MGKVKSELTMRTLGIVGMTHALLFVPIEISQVQTPLTQTPQRDSLGSQV
jgi:hypothetical protein